MELMKSVTRLPIQTPYQGRHRTHWPSHTGTSHVVMCSLSRVLMFTVQMLQSDYIHSHNIKSNNIKIDSLLGTFLCFSEAQNYITSLLLCLSFRLRAPICVACQHGSELPLFTAALSCFSPLGSSLRLVGSALSDRDVITSPDYCDIITTQNKKMFRHKLSE